MAPARPRWLRVRHAIESVAGVHPRFDRARAEQVLATSSFGDDA